MSRQSIEINKLYPGITNVGTSVRWGVSDEIRFFILGVITPMIQAIDFELEDCADEIE